MFPTDVVPLSTQDNHEQSFVVRKNDELLLFSLVFLLICKSSLLPTCTSTRRSNILSGNGAAHLSCFLKICNLEDVVTKKKCFTGKYSFGTEYHN